MSRILYHTNFFIEAFFILILDNGISLLFQEDATTSFLCLTLLYPRRPAAIINSSPPTIYTFARSTGYGKPVHVPRAFQHDSVYRTSVLTQRRYFYFSMPKPSKGQTRNTGFPTICSSVTQPITVFLESTEAGLLSPIQK